MNTQKLQFSFFSCCLVLLLAGCTTPEGGETTQEVAAGDAASGEEYSEVTDTTLDNGKADTAASTEGAEGQPATTSEAAPVVEGAPPSADGSTDTAANGLQGSTPDATANQAPANAPSSVDTPNTPATSEVPAAENTEGLAATDGKAPVADVGTPSPEAPGVGASGNDPAAVAAAPVAADIALGDEKAETTEQASTESKDATSATTVAATAGRSESSVEASLAREEHSRRYIQNNRLFGTTRLQIGLNHPNFNESQKGYDTLYGKAKDYPSFAVDWFPLDWWVNPGLSISMGGYSVTGQAAVKSTDGSIVPDPNSQTRLLFIPIQGSFKVEMTPFRQKWIVFDGWVGYEYGWWQETTSVASAIRPFGLMTADTGSTTTTTTTSTPTSKGVKSATVFGASANFLLNWLDERTVRSMVDSMGLSHVYLTTFFETVKTMNPSGLTFGRNIYGLGFTFETVK